MKANTDLKVYVEVDYNNGKSPYIVKCYANHKWFCACNLLIDAKNICDLINYPRPRTKAEYVILLTACGYLSSEWREPKNLKRLPKTDLIRMYGRVLSAIVNPKGCIVGEE